ncbi:MAG: Gfo/Idh/MocA family oxidoreductase [Kiritimatiellae bacterium]|nr:Gfo/Idh/MocA family oxidoreductase [Kiritimatiellia bacterium]
MNSDKRQFGIAICGLGGMGNWHRETIGRVENLRLAGSFDVDPKRQQFARDHGVRAYGSWKELLADPEVDIVTLAVPNELHRPLAIDAMRAGKNVVCEKPVALSSAELAQMASVADAMGMLFTVHQNRRWDEDFLTVKKIVADGTLGPVFRVESCVLGCRGIPGDWRQLPERGGGMILDWGVHLFDQMLQLFPGDPLVSVRASVDHVTNELVDDGFYAELGFASGLRAHVEVGTSHFISKPRWMVFGRDGSAQVDWGCKGRIVCVTDRSKNDAVPIVTAAGLTKTMAPRSDDTIKEFPLPEVHSDIRDFYRNVMDAIDGREKAIVKIPEVARVMRLMEAVRRSAESGQTVAFESAPAGA